VHLNNYDSRIMLLLNWLTEVVPPGSELLDIGSSDGTFCPEIGALRERGYTIDGVDPDGVSLERNPFLRGRYPARLEQAALPASRFDAAIALYVAEHVEEPELFLEAASKALRPGGSLFLITPNGDHYFAFIAKLLERSGLQERVLRLLRPTELVDRYHHNAFYRMNRPAKLGRMARKQGFERVELRFSESLDEFACYFPGPTKIFPRAWQALVRRSGREQLLGNLMARLIKAE
jgi:2-polyprenyl-3-methyl-5-hydroxy-6-metoxy-1,4-benzoquinol methylase